MSFRFEAQLGDALEGTCPWGAVIGYYLSQWIHLIADGVRPG